ncbi:MAG TPA: hypothetical protein VMZ03_07825 [Chitinophagaceae bacterium]|nr:hypothetical protein [Chitinophagaceae bacterium]
MTWNSVMGVISSVALFLPFFFILVLGLGAYRTFPALLFYYGSVLVYNLMTEGYISADNDLIHNWGIINNMMDTPLMLTFLIYFSPSARFTHRIRILIMAFIVLEIALAITVGLTTKAITIMLGPGILTLIGLCLYFFIRQTKITIMHKKGTGKALIAASLLFAYGCYGIIYLMYYVFQTPYVADTFLVYFLVVTLSSLLITAGIIVEERRIRKLNELKITRRELSDIYGDEKKAIPLQRTAMLDFDRDQWN